MTKTSLSYGVLSIALALALMACKNTQDNPNKNGYDEATLAQIRLETLSGGKLGTTFNASASAYEDPTPAVEDAGLGSEFKYGEFFFEKNFTRKSDPFTGLGPLYLRTSCQACHPGYGHGKRQTRYNSDDWGNAYLLIVTDANGNIEPTMGLVPMSRAVAPFKPMFDEDKVNINWQTYTDEWGNRFPDGETYNLIYPEVSMPEDAFYVTPQFGYANLVFRVESTIGLYGTGLLDAIPDDSIKAEYLLQAQHGVTLNPAIWSGSDWNPAALYADDKGVNHPPRLDYALDAYSTQGNVSLWEVTNVVTNPFTYNYIHGGVGDAYALKASQDADVQAKFYAYFPEENKTGNVQQDIYNYLTNRNIELEMSPEAHAQLNLWLRGLAVPAARNLEDKTIQKGRRLFREIGCATCHRPSWITGPDNVLQDTYGAFEDDVRMPHYPYQTIWPYTDLVQHRLMMKNGIRTGWCRTTPLWGKGLMMTCAGHSDRLHDCRARDVIEAIMWHGAPNSDARFAVERFRQLTKAERDAVVKFINAI